MSQTKNKTENFISTGLEKIGFKYDLTEESGYSDVRKTDYYRSKDCRFMAVIVNSPLEKESPNLIITDAGLGLLALDLTTPTTDNTIFQGIIESEAELLNLFGILKC
jgi:hypothetical protein